MLPIEKNGEINQKLAIALQRLNNLNQAKTNFFTYLIKINSLEKTHAKKIWNSMTEFQDQIVKLTFYSSQKVKRILNFTKIYKEFSHHWQRISKFNIRNLQQLDSHEFQAAQKIVKQMAHLFLQELNKNIVDEKGYNGLYTVYKGMCSNLKEDIERFKTYADPLRFYNEKFTNEFLEKLKKKYDKCTVQETNLKTQTQILDHRRRCLDESLIEVKQAYVPAFEKVLKSLYSGIKFIVDPNKDEAIHKEDFKLKKSGVDQKEFYKGQVENLLGTQSNAGQEDDENSNIKDDFKELFQTNEVTKTQITSDEKFFYDRCQNLKTKKAKRSNEILVIQKLLINQFKNQITNLKHFESEFKKSDKEAFGSDGSETFSKKFRTYFGKNFHQVYELCMLICEKRKGAIEKIYKIIEKLFQKLDSTYKEKKQKLRFFQNRTNYILQNLKKIKDKAQANNFTSDEIIREYKSQVVSTYEDFSKNYKQLQMYEEEMDNMFFKSLQEISDLILKEAINKSLSKILQKEKNRMEIFRQLKLTTEAQTNFYEDVKYEIFFSRQIDANLSKNFKSEINTKEFEQTKSTLSEKEHTLNGMIRHKITCCGVKSQLLTKNVKQSFECYLINMKNNKKKISGVLNILSNGISFTQKNWNPFSRLLQIILPSRDIDNYRTELIEGTSVLTINSKKGPIYFYGSQIDEINASMVENIGAKTIEKEGSEKNPRNNSSSSSFLGNSASQSFRLQYEKSTSSSFNKLEKLEKAKSPRKQSSQSKLIKNASQLFSTKQLLQKLQLKMMSRFYLSTNFKEIQKQIPIKDDSRFNYNYRNGIHKFLLKEKKRSQINGKVLSFDYSWKVTFPQNILLKSFKHYETVYIELEKNLTKIKILHGVNAKNASLAQKIFYEQTSTMNKKIIEMIQQTTERECEVNIEPDIQQENDSEILVDPEDIKIHFDKEATNITGDKPYLTGESFFKNPKFEKSSSIFTVSSGKN